MYIVYIYMYICNVCVVQEMHDSGVAECKFFHTAEGNSGFAVMTNKFQFFIVSNSDRSRDDIRLKALADLPCKCIQI